MDAISRRAADIRPSATMAINKKARQMKAAGRDVVNLSVGEPDFDTPAPIREAAVAAIAEGFTRYTEETGALALREAVCEKLDRENGLSYEPDQVVVSSGAKHSLFNLFLAILNPGDEVIIPAPYWVSYPAMVAIAGGTPVFCPWNERFTVDPAVLESLITDRTRAVVLNSPCNPTGVVFDPKEIEAIAAIVVKHDILCVSDEIYEHFVFDGARHASIGALGPEVRRRTILVNGVSKTFAMTGWRIGYIAAEKDVAAAAGKIQGQTASAPSSVSQKAAIAAIRGGRDLYAPMLAEFDRRRRFLMENVPPSFSFPKPRGGFYLFMRYGTARSEELAALLLEEKGLAVVPGRDFGADEYIRISYATSMANLEKTTARLAEFAAGERK